MRRFKPVLAALPAVIALMAVFSTAVGEEGAGGQGGAFLRMGVGARAVAMGGAFTAIADDATAAYWNPAGLGQLKNPQLGAMYSVMSLDRTHNFVSYVQPISSIGTFAVSWINFGVSKIDGRDSYGNPTGEFSDSEMAFMLSYGKSFADIFHIGGSAKYLVHSLADNKASGFGFDVGALVKISDVISLGAVIQDIGSSITWDTFSEHEDTFPTQIRLGAAVSPKLIPIKLAGEIEKTSEQEAKYHAGVEYWLLKMLAVRGGYSSKGLTAGGSVKVPAGMLKLQADYAFATDKLDGEAVHKISLMMEF